jgi:hypothetical protein
LEGFMMGSIEWTGQSRLQPDRRYNEFVVIHILQVDITWDTHRKHLMTRIKVRIGSDSLLDNIQKLIDTFSIQSSFL